MNIFKRVLKTVLCVTAVSVMAFSMSGCGEKAQISDKDFEKAKAAINEYFTGDENKVLNNCVGYYVDALLGDDYPKEKIYVHDSLPQYDAGYGARGIMVEVLKQEAPFTVDVNDEQYLCKADFDRVNSNEYYARVIVNAIRFDETYINGGGKQNAPKWKFQGNCLQAENNTFKITDSISIEKGKEYYTTGKAEDDKIIAGAYLIDRIVDPDTLFVTNRHKIELELAIVRDKDGKWSVTTTEDNLKQQFKDLFEQE